jgi:Protein of unknown function (DUF2004)
MTTSRHFGALEPTSEHASTKIRRGDEQVRVDLNLAAPAAFAQAESDAVDGAIDELDRLDGKAREAFTAAMRDEADEPVKFWAFHRDEVEGYAVLEREAFVAALQLRRVGFYPDGAYGAGAYAVLDYVLRGPPSDQILVAKLLRDESLLEIAWES